MALLAATLIAAAAPSAVLAVNEFPDPPSTPGTGVQKPQMKVDPRIIVRQCPNMVGQPLDAARKIAAAYRLTLDPITYRPSDAAPGVVIAQDPVIRPGKAIGACAVVLAQAWTVTVPRLVGATVDRAQAALGDPAYHRLLSIGQQQRQESDATPGTILAQSPAAGTQVNRPTPVNVTVASPRAAVQVPNIVGMNLAGAQTTIADQRYRKLLALGRQYQQRESDLPPGTILAQTPAAGTGVNVPTLIYVAIAVPRSMAVVPNVTGMMQPAAEAAIAQPGYKGWLSLSNAGSRDSTLPAGTIIGQDPAPGTRIAGPVALRIWLARPAAVTVIVPDLTGQSPGAAVQGLLNGPYRGLLRLRVVGERQAPNGYPAGTLFAQEPPPGTRVNSLTIINAWTAAPPPPVRVPNLSSLLPPAAGQRLAAAEFRGLLGLGPVHKRLSTARAGTIVDQSPPPQTPVTAPTKIELWVAAVAPAVVVIPNLIDLKPGDAKVQLTAADFTDLLTLGDIREREADKPQGVIIEQRPGAGIKVTDKTKIDVWVAAVPLTVVPDLANMTREGALAALTKAGLSLGGTRTERSERTSGSIVGQSPAAGQRVPRGTAVSIVLVVPPAFWKPIYFIAAALVVLLILGARTAWRRLRPRLARVAYKSGRGTAEVSLDAPEAAGAAIRLRANSGAHEVHTIGDGGAPQRRRLWPKTT